jgi:FixJ family two-component response regulator
MTIKPSIAVVDDDESVREATTGLLRSLGFIAKGFASADEFLRSNRFKITSCVIADVQMPGMSGLALYGHLAAGRNPIPTILITAYPDDEIRARAFSAGIRHYLVKPFSEKELLDSIDEVTRH